MEKKTKEQSIKELKNEIKEHERVYSNAIDRIYQLEKELTTLKKEIDKERNMFNTASYNKGLTDGMYQLINKIDTVNFFKEEGRF